MVSDIQLPVLKGAGNEDLKKFWFLLNSIWNTQQIMDDNIKKAILVSTLQDWVLTWHMNYWGINPTARIADIHTELRKEFNQPKSESQSVVGFKDITMNPGETPWDLDQMLKITICEANMTLTDPQHCAWFIASVMPYIEIGFVKVEDLNPRKSVGGSNAATWNPGTGPRVGILANPSAGPKFVFENR